MKMLLALLLLLAPLSAFAQEGGSISIPIKDYERLKKLEEGDAQKQYWKMSFEQILSKENNNFANAWGLYEFWVQRTIYLDGTVNGSSVDKIVDQIETLGKIGEAPITLVIRSGGGGVLEGMTLVNRMKASPVPVNTVCDSYAMSMAAVIFAVGNQRVATEGCIFMLHDVSVGAPGGQTMEHVKWTETVISIENQLIGILADASGLDEREVRTLMEYETFWTGEEAHRLGFADEYRAFSKEIAARDIPHDLLPLNRAKANFDRKLSK